MPQLRNDLESEAVAGFLHALITPILRHPGKYLSGERSTASGQATSAGFAQIVGQTQVS